MDGGPLNSASTYSLAKDLAFVDPDDKIPLESIIKFYNHKIEEVYNDTSLNNLLEQFKQGRSHMVLVNKIVEKVRGGNHGRWSGVLLDAGGS